MAEETGTIWELFQTNASCDHGFGAIVGQLITYSLCGILRVDEPTKTVYYTETYPAIDCSVELPIFDGTAKIDVMKGVRTMEFPKTYQTVLVKE